MNRFIAATMLSAMTLSPAFAADKVKIEVLEKEGVMRVSIDGEHFTDYVYKGRQKPILWPVIGPNKTEMTRNYPMKKGVKGEKADHPHHESLFFTHGKIGGADFWHGKKDGETIVHTKTLKAESGEVGVIQTENDWKQGDKLICTSTRTMTFGTDGMDRYIDFRIEMKPLEKPLLFGDTKEGSMGIRTHPALRISNGATAVNSEGVKGKAIWGKPAKWLDYHAKIDGQTIGIAIFDHPTNLRHPTTWHARDYGLVAANPFGLSHFLGKGNNGDYTVKPGDTLVFTYRFLFHEGDTASAKIASRFDAWAK